MLDIEEEDSLAASLLLDTILETLLLWAAKPVTGAFGLLRS